MKIKNKSYFIIKIIFLNQFVTIMVVQWPINFMAVYALFMFAHFEFSPGPAK